MNIDKRLDERKNEVEIASCPIKEMDINLIIASKSICKITYKIGKINKYGTGFFMNISNDNSFKSLITNYHVISEDLINKYIELELHNKETKKLFLDNNFRKIIFFNIMLFVYSYNFWII